MRKTLTFLIALSMIVGLVFVTPVSASLSEAQGYAQEIALDENFDTSSYDKDMLTVRNGIVSDGTLNFELEGKSGFSISQGINTKDNKQYVVDFDMTTTAEYTDPWSATFLGLRLDTNAAEPWDNANGAWVGITKDKLILWYSHNTALWGSDEMDSGIDYLVVNAPVDLSSASYRIIYEGSTIELSVKTGDTYTVLVTFTIASSICTMTPAGGAAFTAPVKFTDSQTNRYIDFWNYKTPVEEEPELKAVDTAVELADESVAEQPEAELAGGIDESLDLSETEPEPLPAESAKIAFDNVKLTVYTTLLMTDEQINRLLSYKDTINEILADGDAETPIYNENSINQASLNEALNLINDTVEREDLYSNEADEIIKRVSSLMSNIVSKADVEVYFTKLDQFADVLTNIRADIAAGTSTCTIGQVETIENDIENAKLIVEKSGLTPGKIDSAYSAIANKIISLGAYTSDGITGYSASFTGAFSQSQFLSDWVQTGVNQEALPYSTDNGIPIKMNWADNRRYSMQFRNNYDAYSVKATLTVDTGITAMSLRQAKNTDTYESDYGPSPTMLCSHGIVLGTNGGAGTLYLAVRDGTYKAISNSARCVMPIAMPANALSNNNKTFTVIMKDFGEIVELYVIDNDGEKIKLAVIDFDATVTKLTRDRITNVECYTAGDITNCLTGESVHFTNMAVPVNNSGYITFSARSSILYVKDFAINFNIKSDEEKLIFDGKTSPNNISLELGSNEIVTGADTSLALNADFDQLKIVGMNAYKPGRVDIKSALASKYETLTDSVLTVDKETGKIIGKRRGSEILTAKYVFGSGKEEKVYTDKALVTVDDTSYVRPQVTDLLTSRAAFVKISNEKVFRSIDTGLSIIPTIEYELPNGDVNVLPSQYYVEYKTSNPSIIEYDYATGRYIAKNPGLAKIQGIVYTQFGNVATPEIDIEVTEEGKMTLGTNYTVSVKNIVEIANGDYQKEDIAKLAEAIDSAIAAGIDISYNDDSDILLMFAAFSKLSDDADKDDIIESYKQATGIRAIYDILNTEDTSGDDLSAYLFSRTENYKLFDIDKSDFDDLSKTKQSRVLTRLFTQLVKEGTELTAETVKDSFDSIVEATAGGGGTGKESNSSKTSSGLGNTTFTPAIKPIETPTVKPTLDSATLKAFADKFTDINGAEWAKEAIGSLAYDKIVDGYDDGTIRPNETITRDEFVKLLVLTLKLELKPASNYFTDVDYNAWQNPYVTTATDNGIVGGIGGAMFGSGETITRQDMAVMIYRAVKNYNVALSTDKIVSFTDAERIADYALEAVNKLAASGIVAGMGDGTYAPNALATRAQAMYMLNLVKGLVK